MSTTQVFVLSAILLWMIFYAFRLFQRRSIIQYHSGDLSKKIASDKSILLLDVRTQAEHNSQHIKGSIHIPLQDLKNRMKDLDRYKGKEIVCYCQSGSRSMAAATMLKKLGFTVGNLKGGISDWNFHNLTNNTAS